MIFRFDSTPHESGHGVFAEALCPHSVASLTCYRSGGGLCKLTSRGLRGCSLANAMLVTAAGIAIEECHGIFGLSWQITDAEKADIIAFQIRAESWHGETPELCGAVREVQRMYNRGGALCESIQHVCKELDINGRLSGDRLREIWSHYRQFDPVWKD